MTIAVTDATGYLGTHMLLCLEDAGEAWMAVTDKSVNSARPSPPAEDRAARFSPAPPDPAPVPTTDVRPAGAKPAEASPAEASPAEVGPAGGRQTAGRQAGINHVTYANTLECTSLLEHHDVETVVHFTDDGTVPQSFEQPEQYYQNNTVGTLQILKACIAARCVRHVVFSSTAAVYGVPTRMPISEAAPVAPISPYGASMAMAERMVQDVSDAHGLSCMILRYFNAAGADPEARTGDTGKSRHLVTKIVRLVAQHLITGAALPTIQIFGDDYETPDGTCVRDYVHVTDVTAAHYAAVTHLRDGGASMVLNCGYGFGISVKDVLSSVERVAGIDIPTRISARRTGDPPALIADNAAIRAELDWRPRYEEIDFIVRTAIDWEKKILCS